MSDKEEGSGLMDGSVPDDQTDQTDQTDSQDDKDPADQTDQPDTKDDQGGNDSQDQKDSEEDTTDEGAPEAYEDFTLPEGMEMDTNALEVFAPAFKDLNLTQEQAQDMVDKYAAIRQAEHQQMVDYLQERDDKWVKALDTDKEFGGDKLPAMAAGVNTMLKTFDSDGELVQFLKETGQQNCAPLFKMFARMHPHFSEDVFVDSNDRNKSSADLPAYMKMGWKPLDKY